MLGYGDIVKGLIERRPSEDDDDLYRLMNQIRAFVADLDPAEMPDDRSGVSRAYRKPDMPAQRSLVFSGATVDQGGP